MGMLEDLRDLECNISEGLNRFANHAALYEKMLKKFPASAQKLDVPARFAAKDWANAVAEAHTLKGMTGNLSLSPLYDGYTQIVALLREDRPEQAEKILVMLQPIQERIISCIESYQ